VLRFVNAATHSFPETEHFHRGLRPYGAPSRSCSSRDPAEPRRGGRRPPSTPSACALFTLHTSPYLWKGALRIWLMEFPHRKETDR